VSLDAIAINLLLRALYEAEKRQDVRNAAKAHSFDTWVRMRFGKR
jgi:hypothetical protein